jgi:hypothetical protein
MIRTIFYRKQSLITRNYKNKSKNDCELYKTNFLVNNTDILKLRPEVSDSLEGL